jgi:hypothetical protein
MVQGGLIRGKQGHRLRVMSMGVTEASCGRQNRTESRRKEENWVEKRKKLSVKHHGPPCLLCVRVVRRSVRTNQVGVQELPCLSPKHDDIRKWLCGPGGICFILFINLNVLH